MITPHGAVCTWGTTRLNIQSLRFSASAPAEIDITGMQAIVDTDPNYSNRKIVRRQVDYGVRDLGEVTVEFIANTSVLGLDRFIGTRRQLIFTSTAGGGAGYLTVTSPFAFLTAASLQAQVGDLVRGNLTFKLSDQ